VAFDSDSNTIEENSPLSLHKYGDGTFFIRDPNSRVILQ
jgi:hypothetical protein